MTAYARFSCLLVAVLLIADDSYSKLAIDISALADLHSLSDFSFLEDFSYFYIADTDNGMSGRLSSLSAKGLFSSDRLSHQIILSFINIKPSPDFQHIKEALKNLKGFHKVSIILLHITDDQLQDKNLSNFLSAFKKELLIKNIKLKLGLTVGFKKQQLLPDALDLVDFIEIEADADIVFANYRLFRYQVDEIFNRFANRFFKEKFLISLPIHYSTYALGRWTSNNHPEAMARYFMLIKQMAEKYTNERNIDIILKSVTKHAYFEGVARTNVSNSKSPHEGQQQQAILLERHIRDGLFRRKITDSAIRTAVNLIAGKYNKLLINTEIFSAYESFCDVLQENQNQTTSSELNSVWLRVFVLNKADSEQVTTLLQNISENRRIFSCVTGLEISAEDLHYHLMIQQSLPHGQKPKLVTLIEEFGSTLKSLGISLIVSLSSDQVVLNKQVLQLSLDRVTPLHRILNVSNYFLWKEAIKLDPSPKHFQYFFKQTYDKFSEALVGFEIIKEKFPSAKPVFGMQIFWYYDVFPNYCDSNNFVTPSDLWDLVRNLMHLHQAMVLQCAFWSSGSSYGTIIYGQWNLVGGSNTESKLAYTNTESDPCIKWDINPQNRTYTKTSVTGITLNVSSLPESVGSYTKDFETATIILLQKFHAIELVATSQNLKQSIESLMRVARGYIQVYISTPEDEELKYYNRLTTFIPSLERSGIYIIGFHISVDLTKKVASQKLRLFTANSIRQYPIKAGILFKDCGGLVKHEISVTGIMLLKLADYVICDLPTHKQIYELASASRANFVKISIVIDIAKVLRWRLINIYNLSTEVMLRIGYPKNTNLTENQNSQEYLKFINLVNEVCQVENMRFFLYEAFETTQSLYASWWRRDDTERHGTSYIYIERESEALGVETWRPPIINTLQVGKMKLHSLIWITVLPLVITTVILLTGVAIIGTRYMALRKILLSEEEVNEFLDEGSYTESEVENMASYVGMNMKYDRQLEIQLSHVKIDKTKILGSGKFGTVYNASLLQNSIFSEVAAKIPIPGSKEATKSILCEIKVMAFLGNHPNVLRLIGASTAGIRRGNVYVFTEYCKHGSLLSYLHSKVGTFGNKITKAPDLDRVGLVQQFCRFGKEVAVGMDYICSKKVVHGDLSARNILLDENLVCKISDFGLSTKLYNAAYLNKKLAYVPWRWMAIETLDRMSFSSKSDVWSFGIVLWEIFSMGDVPYSDVNWSTDFVSQLKEGLRPRKPKYASEYLYQNMKKCWNVNPIKRPSFRSLEKVLHTFEISVMYNETTI